MNYDRIILHYLLEAGEKGIAVNKLSKHVFNASNSFFNTISYEEVHQYVAQFLAKNSKDTRSLIERTTQRGYYRLNMQSGESQQLMLNFAEDNEEAVEDKHYIDLSLPLFD